MSVDVFQSYAHHQVTQPPHPHQPPQPVHSQFIHQGAAPASGGRAPPAAAANPYSRGSAYSAHYPRPHGQFPPTQ